MRSFSKKERNAARLDDVENALYAYYCERRPAADEATKRAVATAAATEARRMRSSASSGVDGVRRSFAGIVRGAAPSAGFVAMQARFMGARAWILQACVVVAVVALWFVGNGHVASGMYACLAGAAIAVCGLPEATASRACGIVELERSCKYDARAVALARMVVLACSNAVGLAAIACFSAFVDVHAGVPVVLLYAFAPYCITVAGCLLATRHIEGPAAFASAAAWGATVMTAAYFLAMKMPAAYEQAAVWVWALVAAASAMWVVREAKAWLGAVEFSPCMLSFDSSFINR